MFDIGKIVYGIVSGRVKELQIVNQRISNKFFMIDGKVISCITYLVKEYGNAVPFEIDSSRIFETRKKAEHDLLMEQAELDKKYTEQKEQEQKLLTESAQESLECLKNYTGNWNTVEDIETGLIKAFKEGVLIFELSNNVDFHKYMRQGLESYLV